MRDNIDEKAYVFPLKRSMSRKAPKKGNKDKWLVGTYNGMILVDELITEKELGINNFKPAKRAIPQCLVGKE